MIKDIKKCSVCGEKVEKLYQYQMCKNCIVDEYKSKRALIELNHAMAEATK